MAKFFPLHQDMLENEDFQKLTLCEKVYYLFVLSEVNKRNEYYRADIEYAVALRLSEDKVRRARRKLMGLGFIDCRPGFRSKGKNVACVYTGARWAHTDSVPGGFWAQIPRHTFVNLLDKLRKEVLTHTDVLLYCVLAYFAWRNRGKRKSGAFDVYKRDLQELTGLRNLTDSLNRLINCLRFSDGDRLFSYVNLYSKLVIKNWNVIADPAKSEGSQEFIEEMVQELTSECRKARILKQEREEARERRLSMRLSGTG